MKKENGEKHKIILILYTVYTYYTFLLLRTAAVVIIFLLHYIRSPCILKKIKDNVQ